jgi:hypothetical protein
MLYEENVFGYAQYKKLKVGDLVSWSELVEMNGLTIPEKIKKFGIISSLYIVLRGDRKVALAKVVPLSEISKEREILTISLEIVTKQRASSEF